ncbi:MAG: DCC1-like thiol-disulfide oxidoreductase family protein, partial [Isosphaeraceae bacterium]
MRRIADYLVAYVKDSAQAVSSSWESFWFTPADPSLLGVLRVLTGLMVLYTHAVWGLVLPEFFGDSGWLSEALVRNITTGQYAYSFWWLVPAGGMWPAYWASMAILALFTLGLWMRVTSVL